MTTPLENKSVFVALFYKVVGLGLICFHGNSLLVLANIIGIYSLAFVSHLDYVSNIV